MKREEKHKAGQEFIVEWCKKHKIEIKIQPDYVLDAFECIADAVASEPKQPRANKKVLGLFGVVRSILYWAVCTGLMIWLDSIGAISQQFAWFLGALMMVMYQLNVK